MMNAQCYLCHFRRNVEKALSLCGEAAATAFAKDLMALYLSAPEGISSPWFAPGVAALFEKHCGLEPDRFRQEKIDSNRFVLERLDTIRAQTEAAEDPLYAGLQFAVLGNYIDFSALQGEVSFETLDEMLRTARDIELSREVYRSFCRDLENGKSLLYLTDNAGEIGFDRILAEQIHRRFPHIAITFCVRGGPAQNDATRADAAAVGIPFPVIDNGNTVPGTELSLLGSEAKQMLEAADVILAKGQGNAETLMGCGKNIYYAFLVKCRLFMELFQLPKLTPVLAKEQK